jgi:hypothetical protein
VDDVYSWTVNTPGVETVSGEIGRFRKNFSNRTEDVERLSPLVLGIVGPPGSGKTHLLLFARAKLERELPTGLALMLRAEVMPWDAWYTKVCGAALQEANLPRLFTELLAREASTVARALPATSEYANVLASRPARVFDYLRKGDISASDVEVRFRNTIDTLCPEAPADLRAVLGSLQRRDLSSLAVNWLAGQPIDSDNLQRLGADQPLQVASDGASVLAALAAVCRRLGRVFLLCIDELERLTDWTSAGLAGSRTSGTDRRNVEWLRKLAEGVAHQGGAIILAGQPRAWMQPVDVLDRLSSRSLIELAVWDADGVRRLIESAGSEWAERWTAGMFESVAKLAGGNIRRIQTMLFELFARTADEDALIGPAEISAAAKRLHRSDHPLDLLGLIVRTAERNGGTIEHDSQPLDGLVLDILVRKNGAPHLAVRRSTAGFVSELARIGIEFWQQLGRLRRRQGYDVRGLLIVQGANDPSLVLALDNYSTMTVIDGEAADVEEQVAAVTVRRMAEPVVQMTKGEFTTEQADTAVAAEVIGIAERSEEAKLEHRTALVSTLPKVASSEIALSQSELDVASALRDQRDLERTKIVQRFREMAHQDLPLKDFAVQSSTWSCLVGLAALFIWLLISLDSINYRTLAALTEGITGSVIICLAVVAYSLHRTVRARDCARLSRRLAYNLIDELELRDSSIADLARARSRIDKAVFHNDVRESIFEKIRGEALGKCVGFDEPKSKAEGLLGRLFSRKDG